MKNIRPFFAACAAGIGLFPLGAADISPTLPPRPLPPLNDWLRSQSPAFEPLDLGAQLRARFEHREFFATPGQPGVVDFRSARGNPDNSYLLLREKIHLGYTAAPWLAFFVEARDSSSQNDDRNPNPESDGFDLHQAFLNLGDPAQFPLTLKIGRQELVYGDERLIGMVDWSNVGRTFDAAKLRFTQPQFWIDTFVSRPVLVDDNNFNESNDYEMLSGIYGSTTALPAQETQLYFLARNTERQSPSVIGSSLPPLLTGPSARDIYTLGLRVKSLPQALHGWDYEAEMAGQLGRFKFSSTSRSLDHEALAAHVAGGYTFSRIWSSPRVGLEYNYASGDENPNDQTHHTFDNLFPSNHKFYGYMDLVIWQNIHNARVAFSAKPTRWLGLSLDLHSFWLADTHDFFYQVNGAPRNSGGSGIKPAAGNYVGSELDLVATATWRSANFLQAGYGHFFRGDYIRTTLTNNGRSEDANFLYLQLLITL